MEVYLCRIFIDYVGVIMVYDCLDEISKELNRLKEGLIYPYLSACRNILYLHEPFDSLKQSPG